MIEIIRSERGSRGSLLWGSLLPGVTCTVDLQGQGYNGTRPACGHSLQYTGVPPAVSASEQEVHTHAGSVRIKGDRILGSRQVVGE